MRPGYFGFDTWLSVTNYFDMNPLRSRNGEGEFIEGEPSEIIVSEALKFIEEKSEDPFFTVIWYGFASFSVPGERGGLPPSYSGRFAVTERRAFLVSYETIPGPSISSVPFRHFGHTTPSSSM